MLRNPVVKKKRLLILYLFAGLFLISGAAGLIYEIVWQRLLELYFGVTMISVTLIVSAYMAGLGLGSLIGGRIARNLKKTLFLYGLLEIGIAIFGVFSPKIIVWIGQATAGSSYTLVFLISFAILLIPTALMGMTLPLLTQSFVDRNEL
jgi:spermidine synthase